VVQGHEGGLHVDDTAPPKTAIDFVRDPIESHGSAHVATPMAAPPSVRVTDGANPNDGLDTGRLPNQGPPPEHGGTSGDNMAHTSEGITAADSTTDGGSDSGGISLVGSGTSGAAIHTLADDVTGLGGQSDDAVHTAAPIDQVVLPMAEVQSTDDATAFAPDPTGDPTADTTAFAPDPIADAAPAVDPVAEAMGNADTSPPDTPAESFSGLQVDDSLAIPPEVDLDDGL
jgi:hypothetical protein